MRKPIPANPQRVLLVNTTKYLGNLLLAGGLMQAFVAHCQSRGATCHILLDESFRGLCDKAFAPGTLLWFPRRAIARAGFLEKMSLYAQCLRQVRNLQADLAFNIEDDPAASHLTRLSGAAFKLGCSPARHQHGYHQVLAVDFENREPSRAHRWDSYFEVFAALGMPETPRGYLQLAPPPMAQPLEDRLRTIGWDPRLPTVALHAGATKEYKKWPSAHMAALIELCLAAGLQPVLLGAGNSDLADNAVIRDKVNAPGVIDLCNQLSLPELAQFLGRCKAMVGNDSGPFHLGSALGVPGLVLWGPTNSAIWGPLGKNSTIVTGTFTCDPACNKGFCQHEHRCLAEITPQHVFGLLRTRISR